MRPKSSHKRGAKAKKPPNNEPKGAVAARRALVEKSLRERGWTEAVVTDLLQKTGVSRATLYRDRDAIASQLAAEESPALPERRALFLAELRRARTDAVTAKSWATVARLLAMELQILGLDRVPLPEVAEESGPIDVSLEGVLGEVRRMRRQSQAGHSYVAAQKLIDREAGLVESIRLREEARAQKNLEHLDEAAKLAMAVEFLRALPATLLARVLAELR